MTREQLDALEALLAKATPGPWWAQREYDGGRTVCNMRHQTETVCINKATHVEGNPWDKHWDNANLIQELRNNAAALIAAAREALELREALEWMWKSNDAQKIEFRMPMNGHGYRIALRGPYAVMERHGEGATPLEAIRAAREAHDAE